MGETQNHGDSSASGASVANAKNNISMGKQVKDPEAHLDLSEDDLLGEENEVSEEAWDFIGVKKGHSVNVRTAASLTLLGSSSAPARLPQQPSQTQQQQPVQTQQLTKGAGVQAAGAFVPTGLDSQKNYNQQSSVLDEEQDEAALLLDGAAEGVITIDDQHLGILSDAMGEAGLSADGGTKKELGSMMTMVVLSDGELTPVRRSKRNADVADVHALEKAEKIAYRNLEEPQGNVNALVNSVTSFSSDRIEHNLGVIGITMGDGEKVVAKSVALILDTEKER